MTIHQAKGLEFPVVVVPDLGRVLKLDYTIPALDEQLGVVGGPLDATGWVAVGGIRVCVDHASGLTTCYYHTSAVYVSVGQQVSRGQIIAAIGLTGVTTGPHVHWECKRGEQFLNCLGV